MSFTVTVNLTDSAPSPPLYNDGSSTGFNLLSGSLEPVPFVGEWAIVTDHPPSYDDETDYISVWNFNLADAFNSLPAAHRSARLGIIDATITFRVRTIEFLARNLQIMGLTNGNGVPPYMDTTQMLSESPFAWLDGGYRTAAAVNLPVSGTAADITSPSLASIVAELTALPNFVFDGSSNSRLAFLLHLSAAANGYTIWGSRNTGGFTKPTLELTYEVLSASHIQTGVFL